MLAYI